MRWSIALLLTMSLITPATATDLGNRAPVKAAAVVPVNVPAPKRQGGDTILNATVIAALPYSDTGTTAGYVDDYDEICPYPQSHSPDVVYRFAPTGDLVVGWDLNGSDYDTKLYVYDSNLNVIACNDDYYDDYTSRIDDVAFEGGQTYYIVIDGYGGDFGNYMLQNTWLVPSLECPTFGVPEGEPPLADEYVDDFNGGCNTPPEYPFQALQGDLAGELVLCGVSGWYLVGGSGFRDTDWFKVVTGPAAVVTLEAEAELPSYLFELGPQDCDQVGVIQTIEVSLFAPDTMTITGYAPGDVVWVWVGPTTFAPPGPSPYEFDYVVWFTGLEPAIATEPTSWSAVKALYD